MHNGKQEKTRFWFRASNLFHSVQQKHDDIIIPNKGFCDTIKGEKRNRNGNIQYEMGMSSYMYVPLEGSESKFLLTKFLFSQNVQTGKRISKRNCYISII